MFPIEMQSKKYPNCSYATELIEGISLPVSANLIMLLNFFFYSKVEVEVMVTGYKFLSALSFCPILWRISLSNHVNEEGKRFTLFQ